ncbi:expressed unknown protein [Seminavis robusta]|uniref:Uncharacterized protein n=1 Tax=Seminavis robusta TaxID=568900 RepID=A0A9N8DTZ9_9STRA|nr:expressed unknown protein [Seminavis robusta]|eukprot:Sro248_g098310.1 n/a (545) ;mRNA; r:26369-28003
MVRTSAITPVVPVMPKGILKQEGAPPKPKRNIVFKEGLIADEPPRLSTPITFNVNLANELEQENFRQVWREVSNKKLDSAARVLQKFARKFMLCWILTNDRRAEIYDELDYVDESLRLDLERLEWEKEDMYQEAKLEVQAEREDGTVPPEEVSAIGRQLKEIKEMQREVRQLKSSNERMRSGIKSLKKTNKQLGYDLKEKAPAVEMSKYKVANLESNHRKYQYNHDQYEPNIKKWQDSIDKIARQQYECKKSGILYRNACINILYKVRKRYPKKRVLEPILDAMDGDFANYYPVPGPDDEYVEPPPPPPPPPLPSALAKNKVAAASAELAENVTKPIPNAGGATGRRGVRRTKQRRHSERHRTPRKNNTDSELLKKVKEGMPDTSETTGNNEEDEEKKKTKQKEEKIKQLEDTVGDDSVPEQQNPRSRRATQPAIFASAPVLTRADESLLVDDSKNSNDDDDEEEEPKTLDDSSSRRKKEKKKSKSSKKKDRKTDVSVISEDSGDNDTDTEAETTDSPASTDVAEDPASTEIAANPAPAVLAEG